MNDNDFLIVLNLAMIYLVQFSYRNFYVLYAVYSKINVTAISFEINEMKLLDKVAINEVLKVKKKLLNSIF